MAVVPAGEGSRFPLELQWLRFGTSAGSSTDLPRTSIQLSRSPCAAGSSSASNQIAPVCDDRAARFSKLCEGLAVAKKRIEVMERRVRSSPARIEARLADLVAGIAAAERRLASLEMASEAEQEAQEAPDTRIQRLQVDEAAPVAPSSSSDTIPSSTCEGVAPSDADRAQEAKVASAALARGFSAATAAFRHVPADYYDRSLEARQVLLGAPSVDYLCKTIVVENRKWELAQALPPPEDGDAATMAARSRYFGVVFQYGARFKKENMEREVRKRGGLTKKQCQILFADEGEVVAMTGFVHNSVTPVGSACDMPIYLSHHVDELDYFWMGGGAVNLKLKVDTALFKAAYEATVGLVTVTSAQY